MHTAATLTPATATPAPAPAHPGFDPDLWCALPAPYAPAEYRIKAVTSAWEREAAYALRRSVFCGEQGIFTHDDRDAIDDQAQLLVACSCVAGDCDEVVGTVRIHEASPGVWWGSRLAVHAAHRDSGRLGATLIRLAVSWAHAQGAHDFWAHVQQQNIPLFEKLHWRLHEQVLCHGHPHGLMQASLAHYPACHAPEWGYLTLAHSGHARGHARDQSAPARVRPAH
jgi:putative N-acetyltransferase (TIGR04045 family)